MPTPRGDETREEFMDRCIPVVIDDGTADDPDQAVAICSSMWEQAQEESKSMIRKTVPIEVERKSENGGQIVISTGAIDRERDRVLPSGAQVEDYLRNPVVQYGHNYYEPWATVGRTTGLQVTPQGIVADFELRPAANDNDPQNIVRLLWEGDWIRTASIGFLPIDTSENEAGGLDYTSWQLLEWSLVPVPANQEALRLAVKGLDVKPVPESASQKISRRCEELMAQGTSSAQAYIKATLETVENDLDDDVKERLDKALDDELLGTPKRRDHNMSFDPDVEPNLTIFKNDEPASVEPSAGDSDELETEPESDTEPITDETESTDTDVITEPELDEGVLAALLSEFLETIREQLEV